MVSDFTCPSEILCFYPSVLELLGSSLTSGSNPPTPGFSTMIKLQGSGYRYGPVSLDYDSRGTVPYL